jgi:fructosamine-3-kinase
MHYQRRRRRAASIQGLTDQDFAAMSLDPAIHETLETRVSRILGDRVVRSRTLAGGMMGDVVRMTFESGPPLVVKSAGADAHLRVEADMLRHLRGVDVVPVPEVIHAEEDLLIMEYVEGDHLRPEAEAHCGSLLAKLHDVTGEAHGFGGVTLNGRVILESPWTSSWVEFFATHRLQFSLKLADAHRPLPPELRYDVYAVLDRIPELLREPERPSLLHGDLWAANVLSQGETVTVFLDPSVCYGDPEFELAYVDAWHSFGEGFWSAYTASHPIDEGFRRVRRHVYALYPLLMHVYYFGDRFIPRLAETLTTIRRQM